MTFTNYRKQIEEPRRRKRGLSQIRTVLSQRYSKAIVPIIGRGAPFSGIS
jgi:hypothetical protein